jgi:tetratricopeptide (TPR) repeat protein
MSASPPTVEQQIEQLRGQWTQLLQQGRFAEALAPATAACDLARQHLGPEHPTFATTLSDLAGTHRCLGNFAEAERLYLQTCDLLRRGGDTAPYARALNGLAQLHLATRNFAAALPLYQQAREIFRRVLGEDAPEYAGCLTSLAQLYEARYQYQEAEPLYLRAAQIMRSSGEADPVYPVILDCVATFYRTTAKPAAAEQFSQQALAVRRRTLRADHPDIAANLDLLASFAFDQGKYAEAERLYQQAGEIYGRTAGQAHFASSNHLLGRAALYTAQGRYPEAETCFREAADSHRRTWGEDNPGYAEHLLSLAAVCSQQAKYAEAEALLQRACAILRRVGGADHVSLGSALNTLGMLYLALRNLPAAEQHLREAGPILRHAWGEAHPNYSGYLTALARVYQAQGKCEVAEPLYRQALEVTRQAQGEGSAGFGDVLGNLAGLHYQQHRYAEAEDGYRRAADILRQVHGDNSLAYATTLSNLAPVYQAQGKFAAAEALYRQTEEIIRGGLGAHHPGYAALLSNWAVSLAATGRPAAALELASRAAAIDDQEIGQVFAISSDRHRLAYLRLFQVQLELFLSLVWRHLADSPAAIQAAFDLVLRRKALAAEALAAQRDAVYGGRYPHLQALLAQLAQVRTQIIQTTLVGPTMAGTPTAYRQRLDRLNADREHLEQELARQIPEMNLERRLQTADRRAVALALPEGVALVEFVRCDVFDFHAVPARGERQWQPARYLAFVLAAGEPDGVQMIDLREAEPIDRLIADFRAGITGDPDERRGMAVLADVSAGAAVDTPATDAGSELRARVFDPLRPALARRRRLLLAPDGDLTRLPFEALPAGAHEPEAPARGPDNPEGPAPGPTSRLIDRYEFSYLSSGRDVLRLGRGPSRPPGPAVVAADPDFDLGSRPPTARAGRAKGGLLSWLLGRGRPGTACEPGTPPAPAVAAPATGRHSRDLDRAAGASRLPGTRAEGEQIAALLRVKPWLEEDVLEVRVKGVRSPRVLHLATHGFFLRDQPREQARAGAADRLPADYENPLLRSGLLLAGYNTWLAGGRLSPEAEDGILTAEDVAGMDLLDTDLVVLSACDTGLGEVRIGEGVFGLRRAFVVAGAKTLVMSLWKVPDQQTQQLMVDFYRRLRAGVPRQAALRQAQLALKARYPDPYYWGAFICQGEAGSLPV